MQSFPAEVVDAVLRHMNTDHSEDNLVIVRANGAPQATAARMTGLDTDAGVWSVTDGGAETELRVPWPIPVAERPDIRKAVVVLYRASCESLGVEPRAE